MRCLARVKKIDRVTGQSFLRQETGPVTGLYTGKGRGQPTTAQWAGQPLENSNLKKDRRFFLRRAIPDILPESPKKNFQNCPF